MIETQEGGTISINVSSDVFLAQRKKRKMHNKLTLQQAELP